MTQDFYDSDKLLEHIEKKMFGSSLQKFIDKGFLTQKEAEKMEKDAEKDAEKEKEEKFDRCFCGKCGEEISCYDHENYPSHSKDEPHIKGMCGNCI